MSYSWCCKRACFALQKGVFYISKGHLLPCKRCSFTTRKGIYWKPIMKNLVSNSLFLLSKTYWKAFQPFILTYSYQSITPTFRLHLTVVNLSFLFIFSIHIQYHLCVTMSALRWDWLLYTMIKLLETMIKEVISIGNFIVFCGSSLHKNKL